MIYDGPQEAAKEQHTIEKLEKNPQYFELVQFWIKLVNGNQFNLVSLIQQLTSKCQQIHQNLTNITIFLVSVNSNLNMLKNID